MSGKLMLFIAGFITSIILVGCWNGQHTMEKTPDVVIEMPALEITTAPTVYNPSRPKVNDLIHTRLDVRFDWEKHHLLGVATLDFKPYFYPTNKLVLDAKGFDILRVALVTDSGFVDLNYDYDGWALSIELDKTYSRIETYQIRVEYVAKPDDLPVGGSDAILGDKGLYFINTDSTDLDKPTQIWTQGQTESSSCWFPTIDSPNERMTQEMFITVEEKYRTLSNGEHVYSNYNADGSRTDYWKMEQNHSPYLTMMAVGDFVVAHDKWVNSKGVEIPVNYYVEPAYANYAYKIFGNTPEMMSFFSELLNYDYPWPKYSQVIVRDYVSGAMENTTATIFGEFLNATDRELLDYNNDDIIAHELFHHWFGDLVTCENWANLALNESFATYGEFLWAEHKYGVDQAQITLNDFKESYFYESDYKQENLIRYYYDDKEEMFDSHTYEKGACILHMLRHLVGDEAFFESLHEYLVRYQFQDAEVHKLRLIFEEITGLDLKWFFDQWFLGAGHPELTISYDLDRGLIAIDQEQSSTAPFRLPVQVDVHYGNRVEHVDWQIENWTDTLHFEPAGMTWIKFDPGHLLLADVTDNHPRDWFVHYSDSENNVLDRLESLTWIDELDSLDQEANAQWRDVVQRTLSDPFGEVRIEALWSLNTVGNTAEFKSTVLSLIDDEDTGVAATALRQLGSLYDSPEDLPYFYQGLKARSYYVTAASLRALAERDAKAGLEEAKKLMDDDNGSVKNAVFGVFAEYGDAEYKPLFEQAIKSSKGYERYMGLDAYGRFLTSQEPSIISTSLTFLESEYLGEDRLGFFGARKALTTISDSLSARVFNSADSQQQEVKELLQRISDILDSKGE